ncbi:sigma-70 family RNA polymerase sigma factor [Actinokineospora xionganensis]|uniref:Sigma-70 family RNA polymerase sigma factor n=1 Tax=Actinokineospora xionganensis TaxID=2684470 RepID=A0ABR7L7S3_9PSEU|nr:sigma-70 family RNA polymerase sigma factor [Actinokineospora xionganensis]MBC6448431.1 sigma-70 family RNA polymerase sigma factor [Actinokineospora xionganensis]
MSTVPAELDGPSDAELIDSVRAGTVSAYGPLYERHVGAARNLARQLARSSAEADDLVSEAFAKVLDTLRQGRGPDSAFRAYLLTALRHTAYDKTRRDKKVELSDDVSQVSGVNPDAVSVPFTDTAVAGLERSLAAQAFSMLPERWQAVLWHTEIEGQSPAQVAPLLGLTANGVSALAYRAREGLRQAYLQVHLAETTADRCRSTADRLGSWVRGGLSKRETAQVEAHLDECERCRTLAAELSDINTGLRVSVAPLVLGLGATAGYLAAAKAAAGSAALATAGVATASAGAGAAGAAASAPRQFLGVAASGVALAAAVAVGLASSPSGQQIPAAAPAPTTQAPPPAPPAPPATQAPAPPAQVPPPAPVPERVPEQAVPPPEPTPTATPAPADLSAEGPAQALSLVPGGDPVDLPITVRNTGGSVSKPISATLNLPPGVRAISGPNKLTHNALLRFDAPRQSAQRSDSVRCPGGTGSVTCGTAEGLNPGDSVTLVFRLVADSGATGGQITGTVSAGQQLTVSVSVPVVVKEPATTDGVDVRAHATADGWFSQLWPWEREVLLKVRVVNTGTSTKAVSLGVDEGGHLITSTRPVQCAETPSQLDCATEPLAPNQGVNVVFRLGRGHDHPHDGKARRITVTAVLGTATDQDTVRIPWSHGPGWPGHNSATATNTKPTSDAVEPTKHPVPTRTTSPAPTPTPPAVVVPTPTPEPPPSTEPGTMPTPNCVGGDHRPKRWDVPCPS